MGEGAAVGGREGGLNGWVRGGELPVLIKFLPVEFSQKIPDKLLKGHRFFPFECMQGGGEENGPLAYIEVHRG